MEYAQHLHTTGIVRCGPENEHVSAFPAAACDMEHADTRPDILAAAHGRDGRPALQCPDRRGKDAGIGTGLLLAKVLRRPRNNLSEILLGTCRETDSPLSG